MLPVSRASERPWLKQSITSGLFLGSHRESKKGSLSLYRSAGDRGACLLFWSVREQLAFCLPPLSLFNKETENIFKVFLFDLRTGTLL